MKFVLPPVILSLLAASSVTTAIPAPPPVAFDVMSLRSASPIHFGRFSAARSSIFINLPHQNATCKGGKADDYAMFYIKDEQLFLYSTCGETQRIFVDRSGMGQGKLGYVTGGQPLPERWEVKGWKIDKTDNLAFKDTSFIACPHSINDSWSVWIFSGGLGQPAGNKDCLGFTARTQKNTQPLSCEYTTS